MKKILIIGGMGPQASLLLHKRLIDYASNQGALNNDQYPLIYHISLPVPDFIANTHQKNEALNLIKSTLRCLWPA